MSLLAFFQWCYATPVGETIRDSAWLFPVIEATHLLGFVLTLGAVLIVELRLLGFGLIRQPVAELAANARPWLLGGVTVMFASGIPLFMSESIKAYYSFAFWVKMAALSLALVFTFAVRRQVIMADETLTRPVLNKFVAVVSLSLWSTVAVAGRLIGLP